MQAQKSIARVTAGYAKIPNSLIENQGGLTHPEIAMALIVIRRAADGQSTIVSDKHWAAWTGLSSRMKDYAVKGLKDKGLKIQGRGNTARYTWQPQEWEAFIRRSEFPAKPKINPARKAEVKVKPDMMVHPDCDGGGCLRLQQPGGPAVVIQFPLQSTEPWRKTADAIRAIFPAVSLKFVQRLVAACLKLQPQATDEKIAVAVKVAWDRKRATQKGEGLFLETVPETLTAMAAQSPAKCVRCGSGGRIYRAGVNLPNVDTWAGTPEEWSAACDAAMVACPDCGGLA